MKCLKYVVILLIIFTPTIIYANSLYTKEFDINLVKQVDVLNGSGKVTISLSETNKAIVQVNKKEFDDDSCKLIIKLDSGILKVVLEQTGNFGFFKTDCKVDFVIKVPKYIDIICKVGSGDILINETSGIITSHIGSGSLTVNAEVKKLSSKSGSGNVNVKGLIGDSKITVGSGDIKLKYIQCPKKGHVNILTGSGNAEIQFPENSKIQTSLKAGSGSLKNELNNYLESEFIIKMKSGSGDLYLKKY